MMPKKEGQESQRIRGSLGKVGCPIITLVWGCHGSWCPLVPGKGQGASGGPKGNWSRLALEARWGIVSIVNLELSAGH